MNSISKKDKVAIIHDTDLDGYTAAILLYNFCKKNGVRPKTFGFVRGISSFRKFGLERFDKILIVDLGSNVFVKESWVFKGKKVFYTDHHPSDDNFPRNVLELKTKSEISSAETVFKLIGGTELLKAMALSADVGSQKPENRKQILKYARSNGLSLDEFFRRVNYRIVRTGIYFHKNPRKVFNILKKIRTLKDLARLDKYDKKVGSEIERNLRGFKKKKEMVGKVTYYPFYPRYPIKSAVITELSFKSPKKTFVFACPKSKDIISLSARNQTGKVKMNDLLKECTKNLKKSSAGGHDKASGATIQKKDLKKFKQNLREYSKKLKS